ncbi:recombination protein NinB [Phyllobacterium sp. 22229]|uniref:recombination protein NinB n=1 Tax=Phyllobacterium sp. 22229 TaxID=3453895 RepID=UPI003F842A2C
MSARAVVTIQDETDRARVAKWAKNVEVGTIVEFRKKTRSNEQNAKLHAMLGEVAEQVVWYGRKLDSDDWKNLFTASLRVADVVPGIDRGTIVPLGIRTSSMTIEEMGNLITLIYAFGDTQTPPVKFKEPRESNTETSADDLPTKADAGSDVDAISPDERVASDLTADEADQPDDVLDPPAEASLGSTISGMTRMLMEECIDSMVSAAIDLTHSDDARKSNIESLIGIFKSEEPLSDSHDFIYMCAETARRIIGKPAEEARARSFLTGKIPSTPAVEVA